MFIFLDEDGAEKLKELTTEALKHYVAVEVNGESAGLTQVQVVHNVMDRGGKKFGLLTFSVGQDAAKGKALAAAIHAAAD